MDINDLVYEDLNSIKNKIKAFGNDVKTHPLGYGSVAAALYKLYAGTKGKKDKLEAIINGIPGAAKTALGIFLAGHALKNINRELVNTNQNNNQNNNKNQNNNNQNNNNNNNNNNNHNNNP